jgi:ATP-dependent Lon protease
VDPHSGYDQGCTLNRLKPCLREELMEQIPLVLPVLPIRNSVLFPSVSIPLVVGRGRSIQAVEYAHGRDDLILVVAQKNADSEDPEPKDLYEMATLCKIEGVHRSEEDSRQVVVTGLARYRLHDLKRGEQGFLTAKGELMADLHSPDAIRNEALFYQLKEMAREIVQLLPGTTEALVKFIDRVDDPSYLAHVCAAYLNLSLAQKQQLLETLEVEARIEILLKAMQKELEILSMQQEIRDKMSERLNKAQREAFLREQLRAIKTELGEEAAEDVFATELEKKLGEVRLPEEVLKQAQEEMKRLKSLPPASAEFHVIRNYLEWIIALPWDKKTEVPLHLRQAKRILDQDHYGLEEVKKRILQFLAVAQLKKDTHGPILCLVGPPGVGKTSLGQSIARALGRSFIRTSLGGVRDEAEIRGHRRTYVGAMPGRIIQSIRRVGTKNPLMMLDEVDKLRSDFHGDPASAMLEVLDPEQNKSFVDHYLDLPFDLSEVFFVVTANVVDTIPSALRDRMEVIEVSSYTSYEKLEIARRYLVPKLLKEHGIPEGCVTFLDESLEKMILAYTHEAGVRELQRKIASVLRVVAERLVALQESTPKKMPPLVFHHEVTPEFLKEALGPERFYLESAQQVLSPGVATGLAWTPQGGDLLFVETTALPSGKGALILTGQLGDVMKESVQIALSVARNLISSVLPAQFDFSSHDLHVHVPAGAIPKDGPSAGVTVLLSLVSLILKKPLSAQLGMTGEITLRGLILPVGGIKEKVLAAHRAGLTQMILPKKNEPDLIQVPLQVRQQLEFKFFDRVEDVLNEVFQLSLAPTSKSILSEAVIQERGAPAA